MTRITSPVTANFRRKSVLLGAVAVLALGGTLAQTTYFAPQAQALTSSDASAGPGSFADVVDAVRGAVVSVKVDMEEKTADDNAPPMPKLAPGDPMERFFRQFGPRGEF